MQPTINAYVPPVGSWHCATRPTIQQIARQSRRSFRASERIVAEIHAAVAKSHEADAAYQALTDEVKS